MINDCHVDIFGWATKEEVQILKLEGLKINKLMVDFFKERKSNPHPYLKFSVPNGDGKKVGAVPDRDDSDFFWGRKRFS